VKHISKDVPESENLPVRLFKEMKMKLNGRKFFHLMMASIVLLAGVMAVLSQAGTAEAKDKSDAQAFHDAMRKLWEDHITWTRLTIVSLSNGLPDTDPTVQRLLQNQTDIGNAIKPYYGDAAGDQLTALLRDHILIAAEIIQAAKSGDTAAQNDAIARWYANADDISIFLNSANPSFWPLDEMKDMMREHLDLTLQEAVSYLTGDHAASIAAYDQIHLQALEMADMLSDGIVRQFPKRFK
jgi:hypothetical protein